MNYLVISGSFILFCHIYTDNLSIKMKYSRHIILSLHLNIKYEIMVKTNIKTNKETYNK